jgi:galactokinase/mevalonate kinase-like predicted kinase
MYLFDPLELLEFSVATERDILFSSRGEQQLFFAAVVGNETTEIRPDGLVKHHQMVKNGGQKTKIIDKKNV